MLIFLFGMSGGRGGTTFSNPYNSCKILSMPLYLNICGNYLNLLNGGRNVEQ
jgi:hypothetical protein